MICASQTLSSSILKLWSQASLPTGRQCVRPTIRLSTFNTALISAVEKVHTQNDFFFFFQTRNTTLYHHCSPDVVLICAIAGPTGQFVGFGHLAIVAACGQTSPHSQGLGLRGAAGGRGSTGHTTAAWHRFQQILTTH